MSEHTEAPAEQKPEPTTETVRNPEAVLEQNKELLSEVKRLKQLTKQVEGIDPAEYRALKEAQARAEEEHLAKKGEFDKILEQKEKAWNERLSAESAEKLQVLNGFTRKELELMYLQKYGGREGYSDLAVEKVIGNVETITKNGSIDIQVKDGVGDAKDFDKLFGGLKERYPALFKSEIASGSGATGSDSKGGTTAKTWSRAQWEAADTHQRSEFSRSGGQITN